MMTILVRYSNIFQNILTPLCRVYIGRLRNGGQRNKKGCFQHSPHQNHLHKNQDFQIEGEGGRPPSNLDRPLSRYLNHPKSFKVFHGSGIVKNCDTVQIQNSTFFHESFKYLILDKIEKKLVQLNLPSKNYRVPELV